METQAPERTMRETHGHDERERREPPRPESTEPRVKFAARGLNLWYGAFQALQSIDIEVYARQITALIGPSGCGKSSFLRCLNRMNDLVPGAKIAGEVLLDGQNIYRRGIDVPALRKRVGMVFQ